LPGPKFVFAHFVLPHHPYLFDANGNVLREATVADQFEGPLWNESDQFVDQLRFVNSKILTLVDQIAANSAEEPIIILISDHGIRPDLRDGSANLAVRFANFTAIRQPLAGTALPTDITPVNLFRILFNHYLGANYAVLPDRHLASSWTRPYDFVEVQPADSMLQTSRASESAAASR
jgi:hypothetical protein